MDATPKDKRELEGGGWSIVVNIGRSCDVPGRSGYTGVSK